MSIPTLGYGVGVGGALVTVGFGDTGSPASSSTFYLYYSTETRDVLSFSTESADVLLIHTETTDVLASSVDDQVQP